MAAATISMTTARATAARRFRTPFLALALLAAGCSSPEAGLGNLWSPFAGSRDIVASNSLTVQRVRGTNPEVEPLVPEAGNVWPEPEAPRPTLMSGPDEAMRNIPDYRPSLIDGAPPASSPVPTPGVGPRRGSSSPPPAPPAIEPPQRSPVTQPASPVTPPPPRLEGRPMIDPSGRPAIGTGGTPRVQGYTQPGVGGGAVIRDGNVETWIGPDGRTHTRVAPN